MSRLAARDILAKDCIIVAESHISDELEEKFGDFVCVKKYIHGFTKVSIYKIGDEDENCGMSGKF